tara:strand:+ start:589 stop:792 length:204 start_codon:yes stop_codon:yes gene_type:complete
MFIKLPINAEYKDIFISLEEGLNIFIVYRIYLKFGKINYNNEREEISTMQFTEKKNSPSFLLFLDPL